VEDKKLDEKAKEVKAAYMKNYRKRPGVREKQIEYERKYWRKKAKELEQADI